jgi:hypothetical protein
MTGRRRCSRRESVRELPAGRTLVPRLTWSLHVPLVTRLGNTYGLLRTSEQRRRIAPHALRDQWLSQ